MKRLGFSVGFALPLLVTAVINLPGATNFVRMTTDQFGNPVFSPNRLTNTVGDTVIWTNTSLTTGHNTVSSNGLWASSIFLSPGTFPFKFNNAGTFGYYCMPHLSFGMTGIIFVRPPPNNPPSIVLTAPTNNLALVAPASITLTATASDTDGNVTNVQFFNGATLLGADTTSPYSLVLNNLTTGNYSFTARAFDNLGASSTSAVVQASVVDLRLSSSNLLYSATDFPVTVLLTPGRSYALEVTSNFTSWSAVSNFVATSNSFRVNFPPIGPDRLFYRARVLSGP